MKLLRVIPLGLMMMLFATLTYGKEVKVEEVSISLYNKPVTGYKLVLDRSQSFVADRIVRHIAESDETKPFQFESTIIYENLRYAPISDDRDLSLYYMLRSLENQFTEVVVVAMYDYRRSVNSRDFPDLSIRLQLDLASFVRRTTGDVMVSSELVFDDATIQQLSSQFRQPVAEDKGEPVVEHFEEEEVENEGVMLRENPFEEKRPVQVTAQDINPEVKSDQDPEYAGLKKEVRDLKARERKLLDEQRRLKSDLQNLQRRQEGLQVQASQNKMLRDSVVILNERIKSMIGQHYISDDISVSNETAGQLRDYEAQLKSTDRRLRKLRQENDSLSAINRDFADRLDLLAGDKQATADELIRLRADKAQLLDSVHVLQSTARLGAADGADAAVLDSMVLVLRGKDARELELMQELAQQTRENERLQEDNTWLTQKKTAMEQRIAELEAEKRAMANQPEPVVSGPDPAAVALRDSLKLMSQRLKAAESRLAAAEEAGLSAAEKETALQRARQELAAAQSAEADARRQLKDAQQAEALAQQRLNAARKEVTEAREATQAAESRAASAQSEKEQAQARLAAQQTRLDKAQAREASLQDSLASWQGKARDLRRNLDQRDRQVRQRIAERDSVAGLLANGRQRENELRREISALQATVDSLEASALPANNSDQFIRERWSKLQAWEKELDARDASTSDREKLLDKRESVMAGQQEEMAAREARYKDLEERENRLRALEQKLNAQQGVATESGAVPIRQGKVVEFGEQVPVLIVESPRSYKGLQRQVVGFMLQRDELYDDQFPDIVYKDVNFPELGAGPVEMKARISTQGAGSVLMLSFRLADGTYIGRDSDKKLQAAARQLSGQIARYND